MFLRWVPVVEIHRRRSNEIERKFEKRFVKSKLNIVQEKKKLGARDKILKKLNLKKNRKLIPLKALLDTTNLTGHELVHFFKWV